MYLYRYLLKRFSTETRRTLKLLKFKHKCLGYVSTTKPVQVIKYFTRYISKKKKTLNSNFFIVKLRFHFLQPFRFAQSADMHHAIGLAIKLQPFAAKIVQRQGFSDAKEYKNKMPRGRNPRRSRSVLPSRYRKRNISHQLTKK